MTAHLPTETLKAIRASLGAQGGGVLEYVAADHGVTPADVMACLPDEEATVLDGGHFEEVMGAMTAWGTVTFLVHTDDLILECRGEIPPGSTARGYFNLHGSPIGGHLKAVNCATIAFVSRPLFGRETRSVQFYNRQGGCMFKVYLGRDEHGALDAGQVGLFEALRDRLAAA